MCRCDRGKNSKGQIAVLRFQFSLKWLLLAMLVVGLAAGIISWLPPDYRLRLAALVVAVVCCLGMVATALRAVALVIAAVVFLLPPMPSNHNPRRVIAMPRPQFTLKTLLWLMVVVAAFLGGMALQRKRDEPEWISKGHPASEMSTDEAALQIIRLPDGTKWQRNVWGTREDQAPRSSVAE